MGNRVSKSPEWLLGRVPGEGQKVTFFSPQIAQDGDVFGTPFFSLFFHFFSFLSEVSTISSKFSSFGEFLTFS